MALVPHQDAMCLWDAVPSWDDTRIVLHSDRHRDVAHPLRSGGRLHAVHLCEYGAQAMAVHGGLRAGPGVPAVAGVLVSLRGVVLHVDRIDGLAGTLECVAELLVDAPGSQQYAFRISHAGNLLAEGRAAVVLGGTAG
ncbi:MAG TPA: phosphotransferase [Luteimonas sp.]|nr:phosphotransferase [Luteimonas sp.]